MAGRESDLGMRRLGNAWTPWAATLELVARSLAVVFTADGHLPRRHAAGRVRVLHAVLADREGSYDYGQGIRHAVVDSQSWCAGASGVGRCRSIVLLPSTANWPSTRTSWRRWARVLPTLLTLVIACGDDPGSPTSPTPAIVEVPRSTGPSDTPLMVNFDATPLGDYTPAAFNSDWPTARRIRWSRSRAADTVAGVGVSAANSSIAGLIERSVGARIGSRSPTKMDAPWRGSMTAGWRFRRALRCPRKPVRHSRLGETMTVRQGSGSCVPDLVPCRAPRGKLDRMAVITWSSVAA